MPYRSKATLFLAPIFLCACIALAVYFSGSTLVTPQLSAKNEVLPDKIHSVLTKVQEGDTLLTILDDMNISSSDAFKVVNALKSVYDPAKLHVGQEISISYMSDGVAPAEIAPQTNTDEPIKQVSLKSLNIRLDPQTKIIIERGEENSKNFKVEQIVVPVERRVLRAQAVVDNSLFDSALEAGIPAGVMLELIKAYSYDVDFQRDIRSGDRIEVMYEEFYTKDGLKARDGEVLFSSLTLGGKSIDLYRHVAKDGTADFYGPDGKTIRKTLLQTPINGARISSVFGFRRHPVLGYSRMHKGVDFAAPKGTPIYAAGDGTIKEMGQKNGYGNYIRLAHDTKYSTAYGHISRFAAGMRKGMRVKQGQIIAYVGATGMATGPHLHYEVLVSGSQVNPKSVKFPTGTQLAGVELKRFRESKKIVETLTASIPLNGAPVAMKN